MVSWITSLLVWQLFSESLMIATLWGGRRLEFLGCDLWLVLKRKGIGLVRSLGKYAINALTPLKFGIHGWNIDFSLHVL